MISRKHLAPWPLYSEVSQHVDVLKFRYLQIHASHVTTPFADKFLQNGITKRPVYRMDSRSTSGTKLGHSWYKSNTHPKRPLPNSSQIHPLLLHNSSTSCSKLIQSKAGHDERKSNVCKTSPKPKKRTVSQYLPLVFPAIHSVDCGFGDSIL